MTDAVARSPQRLADLVSRAGRVSRAEVAWIVVNKSLEVVLLFTCLRLLTRDLGPERFGEYNLALTANVVLAALLVVPVQQAYLRYFHRARARGESWLVTRQVLAWYTLVTLGVVALAAVGSRALGRAFGIEAWTCLAAALAFLADRWRILGIQILNIQRRRTAWALQHLAFLSSQLVLLAVVLRAWPASVTAALLAYAMASLLLATASVLTLRHLRADADRTGRAPDTEFPSAVLSFGVPYGLLVLLQWVQGFSDRYLLGALLDLEAVGVYVAAYQLCGVPFTLASSVVHTFVVPVAYAGAGDGRDLAGDPRVRDVLRSGVVLYAIVGLLAVAALIVFGSRALGSIADARFTLPASVIAMLALGRFLEGLSVLLQVLYEVRQRMQCLFLIRFAAALALVVLCFALIRSVGLFGAALANLVAIGGYVTMMLVGLREREPRQHPQPAVRAALAREEA
jgi:O-antigen/teichoic acid export membrane protein